MEEKGEFVDDATTFLTAIPRAEYHKRDDGVVKRCATNELGASKSDRNFR